jgi:hypothetical protein
MKEKVEGKLLVRLRGAYAPMDMAMVIRGDAFFTDFYDYPEEVKRLMALCTRAIKWSFENQRKIVGPLDGGYITGFSVWLPGDSAGHISEDATVMCSPEIYREFGRPYTAELCSSYDNMQMHLHSVGPHAFADIVSIPGISCVELSNDPNCPTGLELFKQHEKIFEGKSVVLHLNRKEIEDNREFLASKKVIIDYQAQSPEDAQSVIQLVRGL